MNRFVSAKTLQRVIAAAIVMAVMGIVAAPGVGPARGDAPTSIAVNEFQNEAGAPSGVAPALSDALYKAVTSSGTFRAAGRGPLPLQTNLTADAFVDALDAAAKAGADEVLLGSVVQMSGGQVYYRLTLYRVAPVAFIASQVFSQPYPPGDAQALPAAFAGNLNTLAAPRQSVGTIYSVESGVHADLGSSEGFQLGDRFNVMRGGAKVAEASITQLADDDATLSISNATSGYSPAVGDTLVGLRPLPPALPAPPSASSFNPLAFVVGVGAVLLAIGHHGQPGVQGSGISGSPAPSSSPFTIITAQYQDTPPNIPITVVFSGVLSSASQVGIPGNTTYASWSVCNACGGATPPPQALSALGTTPQFTQITGATGQPESEMTMTAENQVSGSTLYINFFPTITDVNGDPLFGQTSSFALGGKRHKLSKPLIIKVPIGTTGPPVGPVNPHPLPPPPPKNPPR